VPEVISHWLRRRLAVLTATGDNLKRTDVVGHDQFAADPVGTAATNVPAEFVRHVLPVILEISDRAVYDDAIAAKRVLDARGRHQWDRVRRLSFVYGRPRPTRRNTASHSTRP
jgi:hypothetical protein